MRKTKTRYTSILCVSKARMTTNSIASVEALLTQSVRWQRATISTQLKRRPKYEKLMMHISNQHGVVPAGSSDIGNPRIEDVKYW
jgi:hypothetical protein